MLDALHHLYVTLTMTRAILYFNTHTARSVFSPIGRRSASSQCRQCVAFCRCLSVRSSVETRLLAKSILKTACYCGFSTCGWRTRNFTP